MHSRAAVAVSKPAVGDRESLFEARRARCSLFTLMAPGDSTILRAFFGFKAGSTPTKLFNIRIDY